MNFRRNRDLGKLFITGQPSQTGKLTNGKISIDKVRITGSLIVTPKREEMRKKREKREKCL
jgi:hypothetical protein